MSKHVGEKCGKLADGDPDGRRVGRTETRTDGRTSPYHNTSRLKENYHVFTKNLIYL